MKTKVQRFSKRAKSDRSFFAKTGDAHFFPAQTKLNVGEPGDSYEQEADRVADLIVRGNQNSVSRNIETAFSDGNEEIQEKSISENITPLIQQKEEREGVMQMQPQEEEDELQAKSNNPVEVKPSVESRLKSNSGNGAKMDRATRTEMERDFGADFNNVNIHTDESAVQMSKEIGAQAFTHGNDVYFNKGKYNPESKDGKHLLAHELTHTIQQTGKTDLNSQINGKEQTSGNSFFGTQPIIQRKEYDPKENLLSKRYRGDTELEKVFDNEKLIFNGLTGDTVRIIQQGLMAFGYALEKYKDDGIFGSETEGAVRIFQSEHGATMIDGIVGPETMRLLDLQALRMEKGNKEKKEKGNIKEAERTIMEKVKEELKKESGDKRAEYALCLLNLYKAHRSQQNIYDKYMGPQLMLPYIENDRGNNQGKTFKDPGSVKQRSSFRTLDRAVTRNSATFTYNLLSEANNILEGINVVSKKNRIKKYRLMYGRTLDFLYKYIKTRMNNEQDIYSCFK